MTLGSGNPHKYAIRRPAARLSNIEMDVSKVQFNRRLARATRRAHLFRHVNFYAERKINSPSMAGKSFRCAVCTVSLPIRNARTQKPYCVCMNCGIQIFVRGKTGVARLQMILEDRMRLTRRKHPSLVESMKCTPAVTICRRVHIERLRPNSDRAWQKDISKDSSRILSMSGYSFGKARLTMAPTRRLSALISLSKVRPYFADVIRKNIEIMNLRSGDY